MTVTYTGNEYLRDSSGKLVYAMIVRNNIRQQAITVSTAAVKLPTTPLSNRLTLTVFNNSANVLYLGGADVTTSNGFPIFPKASLGLYIEAGIDLYGISTGSSNIRIVEGA